MMASFRLRILLGTLLATVSNAQSTESESASASLSTDSTTLATPSSEPDFTSTNSWHAITVTGSAVTRTFSAGTFTRSADTIAVNGGYPGISYPGIGDLPFSTSTVPALTVTRSATTETFAASTAVYTQPPDSLVEELLPDLVYDLLYLAPSITSVPVAVASKLNIDWTSLYGSFTSAHPIPSIDAKLFSDLQPLILGGDPASESLYRAILTHLNPYPQPSETASLSSALSSLLAPYPSWSSEIREWQTEIRNWGASEYLAELQLVTSELSITSIANPTFVSVISAAAVEATATSKAGAAPTAHASVLINAGLAAAGMAVVGLM